MRASRLRHMLGLAVSAGFLFQGCQLILDPFTFFALTSGLNSCNVEFDDGELEEVDCRDDDSDRFLIASPWWTIV